MSSRRTRSGRDALGRALATWGLAVFPACGGDAVLTLGQARPVPAFTDEGDIIAGVNAFGDEEDPTLTEDMLEIYFISDRPVGPGRGEGGSGDVWMATRSARTEPFGAPIPVVAANSGATETSPAISPDGLTLWIGSAREPSQGKLDIWQLTRESRDAEWGGLVNVTELNSPEEDIPRPVARGGRLMPLASRRSGDGSYQIHLAWRDSPEAPFEAPVLASELFVEGTATLDGSLTEDGLCLFFKRAEGDAPGDLFMAYRRSPDEPFRYDIALDDLNTEADERDPWVNADATRFFFSSNRRAASGFDIYATRLELARFE